MINSIIIIIKTIMVKLYRKHLSEPWFSLMSISCKTVEGRLNSGLFTRI